MYGAKLCEALCYPDFFFYFADGSLPEIHSQNKCLKKKDNRADPSLPEAEEKSKLALHSCLSIVKMADLDITLCEHLSFSFNNCVHCITIKTQTGIHKWDISPKEEWGRFTLISVISFPRLCLSDLVLAHVFSLCLSPSAICYCCPGRDTSSS